MACTLLPVTQLDASDKAEIGYGSITKKMDDHVDPRPVYRPDVDGLRAIAVVAVVIYHMKAAWLPSGFTGVDIFFVISGYVVTGSVLRHPNRTMSECFLGFYARRAKRIAPVLVTVVVVAAALIALIVHPHAAPGYVMERHYKTAQYGLFGFANNFLASQEKSYFDATVNELPNPFLHLWSLGVEEQFYFLFPVVCVMAYGNSHLAFSAGGKDTACTYRSATVWLAGIFLSFIVSSACTAFSPTLAFYTLPSRFWELAVGALLFDSEPAWSRAVQRSPNLARALSIFSAVLLGLSLTCVDEGSFPMPGALLPVLGAASFIMAGTWPESWLNRWASQEPVVFVGKISYSLYLWHWPALCLMAWVVLKDSFGYFLYSLAIFTTAALVTYHRVEGAFRSWRPSRQSFVFLAFLVAAVSAAAFVNRLKQADGALYSAGIKQDPLHGLAGIKRMNSGGYGRCECHVSDLSSSNDPLSCFNSYSKDNFHEYFDVPAITSCDAFMSESAVDIAKGCLAPLGGDKAPAIFVFGDSHACHLVPGLAQAAQAGGFQLRHYCRSKEGFTDPKYVNNIKQLLPGYLRAKDIVIISQLWEKQIADTKDITTAAMMDVHGLVSASNATLLMLGDLWCNPNKPEYTFDDECVPTVFNIQYPGCAIPRARASKEGPTQQQMYRQWSREHSDVVTWNFNDQFCNETHCSSLIPSTSLVARDECHLTPAGSFYLWPYFCSFLSELADSKFHGK
eukprot:TRINITY_DN24410_c0_g1_i1.p1 TRINITY_DN24410_c0_g1~~TRINITY_DN24410_c0_g1_i1.p1  ORF type:complete len:735 (-),score=101.54 TRINITY_DN24410_c0_g1_i1:115-2319(-)